MGMADFILAGEGDLYDINKYHMLAHLIINQRTNGPVDAHLLGLVMHKTWKIYGKEMTLTFNTHIPS